MQSNLLHPLVATLIVLSGPVLAAVRYVDLHSTNPTPPYDSWPTAAVSIQTRLMLQTLEITSWLQMAFTKVTVALRSALAVGVAAIELRLRNLWSCRV